MSEAELLAKLKDISLPQGIAFDLAWGWWIVIIGSFFAIIALVVFGTRWYRIYTIRKQLNAKLTEFFTREDFIIQASMLLRRYVQFRYASLNINTMDTEQWCAFLHSKKPLSDALYETFSRAAYQTKPSVDKALLLNYCQSWIRDV